MLLLGHRLAAAVYRAVAALGHDEFRSALFAEIAFSCLVGHLFLPLWSKVCLVNKLDLCLHYSQENRHVQHGTPEITPGLDSRDGISG